jgi:GNAT superfamily N-acetyltransferase
MSARDEVRIDSVVERDVPLLLRLIKALAEYEKLSGEVVATEALLQEALFGPARNAEAALAYVGEDAVGFAVWFYNFSTFVGRPGLYLEDVFVLPDWRGRGVGSALMRHLARLAVQRGCGRMEWAVLDWNQSAIGFYRRLGAQAMDGWTVYRLSGDALEKLAGA